jgi:hypothetical protein
MKNIIPNKSFDKFCYIDEKNNMVDITNKCPIELCKNFKKIIKDDLVLDESIINNPIEDIYHHIIEKTYLTPSWIEEVNLNKHSKKKLIIAFNKFFFNKINENV